MHDRPQLKNVRERFFKDFLDNRASWEVMFVTSRFLRRGEGLIPKYWPEGENAFVAKLMQVSPLLERAAEFIRVRSLYPSEDLTALMARAEDGDSYAAKLYMAANPLPIKENPSNKLEWLIENPRGMWIYSDILGLWEKISDTKPPNIPYPTDKVVSSIENSLWAALNFVSAVDEDDEDSENYDPEEAEVSRDLCCSSALASIVGICEAFDYLGSDGWTVLVECFFSDLEYLHMLKNFEMPRYPDRAYWVSGPPHGWLDYEPGTLKGRAIHRVFVAYAWQGDTLKRWVEELVDWLTDEGLEVSWDMWDSSFGSSLSHFMNASISESDHVLLVLTPEYATRADRGEGGVGAEWELIRKEIELHPDTTKFVGLLKEGDWDQSSPTGFQDRMGFDFRTPSLDTKNSQALLRFLHGLPEKRRFS